MNYKFSVSGYRGIWGESLNREIGRRLANSFARYTRAKTIAIGRDSRPSSFPLREAVMEGLNIGGVSTLDMGLLPTPTSCVNAKNLRIPAIMITASHNILSPEHWNGLKFIGRSGLFLNEREIEKLKAIYAGVQESGLIKVDAPVKNEVYPDPFDLHLSLILNNVNVDLIRSRNFLVALDSVNGAGSFITKILLERLGCRVTSINTDPEMVLKTNDFPHGPEPTPSHITDLCELVKAKRADVGFAQDPDADRLMIVSELGIPLGEEYSLALSAYHLLSKFGGLGKVIVANRSTTMAIDDVAKMFGARVERTKIGEINVVMKMIKLRALIGGEGNGGVIFPPVCYNRCSLTGIALTLEHIAQTERPVSSIFEWVPEYHIVKARSKKMESFDLVKEATEKMKRVYHGEIIDLTDGVHITFKDGSWVHVRGSNTEPIMRVIAEARTEKSAEAIIEATADKIGIEIEDNEDIYV